MATVILQGVWLNLASDLTQALHLTFVTQINYAPQTPGEDRMYGNGRYRSVRSGSTQRQAQIAVQACTPAEVATLRAWDGLTVLYRDDSGEKFYGSFRSPQITRHSYDVNADVSFTVTELTVSEAV